MSDQVDVLKLVAVRLALAHVPYRLTGSMALSYHAEPRFTRDVDLVVQLAPRDVDLVGSLFSDDFCADTDGLRSAIAHVSMANVIHQESLTEVDFIHRRDDQTLLAAKLDRDRDYIETRADELNVTSWWRELAK
jgi:hypothetical protein